MRDEFSELGKMSYLISISMRTYFAWLYIPTGTMFGRANDCHR